MVNVLVTGGAGYIGSHACKALAEAGYTPVVADDLSSGNREAVKWGPLERGDVSNGQFLDAVFTRWRPEAVLHFAGRISVPESIRRPDLYYGNQLHGILTVLNCMRTFGVSRIVLSSTCTIFNPAEALAEDSPIAPSNPYSAAKAMAERVLRDYCASFGMRALALRYFNAAGADPDGLLGEEHNPETHLIPLACATALGQNPHLTIFGDDYATMDGTCVRDYVHVSDLARQHTLALDWLDRQEGFSAFNLGTGTGHTVRQVIAAVERIAGKPIPVVVSGRRAGDVETLVADPRAAMKALHWAPAFSSLDQIVETAWRWHSKGQHGVVR